MKDGLVTLSAQVDWSYERTMAVNAIHTLSGVRLVVNNMTVKPRPIVGDISTKIESAFPRYVSIASGKVKVSGTGDKVTLHGTVRSWSKKEDAEEVTWAALGVSQVTNDLVLKRQNLLFRK